jgi:hypothetical protein
MTVGNFLNFELSRISTDQCALALIDTLSTVLLPPLPCMHASASSTQKSPVCTPCRMQAPLSHRGTGDDSTAAMRQGWSPRLVALLGEVHPSPRASTRDALSARIDSAAAASACQLPMPPLCSALSSLSRFVVHVSPQLARTALHSAQSPIAATQTSTPNLRARSHLFLPSSTGTETCAAAPRAGSLGGTDARICLPTCMDDGPLSRGSFENKSLAMNVDATASNSIDASNSSTADAISSATFGLTLGSPARKIGAVRPQFGSPLILLHAPSSVSLSASKQCVESSRSVALATQMMTHLAHPSPSLLRRRTSTTSASFGAMTDGDLLASPRHSHGRPPASPLPSTAMRARVHQRSDSDHDSPMLSTPTDEAFTGSNAARSKFATPTATSTMSPHLALLKTSASPFAVARVETTRAIFSPSPSPLTSSRSTSSTSAGSAFLPVRAALLSTASAATMGSLLLGQARPAHPLASSSLVDDRHQVSAKLPVRLATQLSTSSLFALPASKPVSGAAFLAPRAPNHVCASTSAAHASTSASSLLGLRPVISSSVNHAIRARLLGARATPTTGTAVLSISPQRAPAHTQLTLSPAVAPHAAMPKRNARTFLAVSCSSTTADDDNDDSLATDSENSSCANQGGRLEKRSKTVC